MNETRAEFHFKQFLKELDQDVDREGLQETPRRVVKMYKELLNAEKFNLTTFDKEKHDQMIVVKDIDFFSLCEHHTAPFFGTASIAYIPRNHIVGLSKLPRTVEKFARSLQNQERLTDQIADFLMKELNPLGVAVRIEARHLCMEMRGVQKKGATTVTTALRACFKDEAETRAEFYKNLEQR